LVACNQVAGELDINSYFKDTWNQKEQQFVEQCARLAASFRGK
jgi:putative methionine-R-sulfoxide reductase with GAF domain